MTHEHEQTEILSKAVDGIITSSGLFDSVDESDADHDVRQQAELYPATKKFQYFMLVLMMQVLGVPAAETVAALQREQHRAAILRSDAV